jgi:hypothetical protein
MKTSTRKRYALFASVLFVVGGLYLACFLWVRAEQRKYTLSRQLIEALKKEDTKQAVTLVEAGADPNTSLYPPPKPSLDGVLKELLHRSSPSANDSSDNGPTALLMACGACWFTERGFLTKMNSDDRHMAPVVEAMLLHGANANATGERGWTVLSLAATNGYTNIMLLLLQHGAAIDVQDGDGLTALRSAVDTQQCKAIKLLLQYHANVNVKDKNAVTPLGIALRDSRLYNPPNPYTEIIHLLKLAGATK